MFRRVWEALFLVVVGVVLLNVIVAAVRPYLPVLGFFIVAGIGVLIWRLVSARRKFW